MLEWPSDLPKYPLQSAFSGTTSDGALRQDMDAGPAYQKPRYTAVVEPFSMEVYLDLEQFKRFRKFWFKDTMNGTQPFEWFHPDTLETAKVQFDCSQGFSRNIFGSGFKVSFTIEVLPEDAGYNDEDDYDHDNQEGVHDDYVDV